MAIKKDAAKADIGPKKQVKATFAECTAEEPLKCKYHGLKALDKLIGNVLASTGHPMPFVTDKHEGEYELRLPSDIDLPLSAYDKVVKALHDRGFQIVNKGQLDNGAFQYQIKPSDGSGFVTPDGEAELEDADTLSSTDAPEKKATPSETDEVDDLEGSHEDGISDDEWKALANALHLDENQLSYWKGMILDYKDEDGDPLSSEKSDAVNNILNVIDLGGAEKQLKKAWEETKKKHQQQAQSQEPKKTEPTDDDWKNAAQKMSEHPATQDFIDYVKGVAKDGKIYGEKVLPDVAQYLDNNLFNKLDSDDPVKKMWDETKKGLLPKDNEAEQKQGETDDADAEAYAELDADLEDNFDEMEEVTEDVESEVLGNGDFDDIIFSEEDENLQPKDFDNDDIKALMALVGVSSKFFEDNPEYLDFYKAVIKTGKNEDGSELWGEQKDWFNKLIDEVKKQGFDNPAAKQLLKTFGKDVSGFSVPKKDIPIAEFAKLIQELSPGTSNYDAYNFATNLKEIVYQGTSNGYKPGLAQLEYIENHYPKLTSAPEANKALLDAVANLKKSLYGIGNGAAPQQAPTLNDLMKDMTSVITKIKNTGLDLTWDAKKGNALGKAFEDAVNSGNVTSAQKALQDFKDYIHALETGDEATASPNSTMSKEELEEEFNKLADEALNAGMFDKKTFTTKYNKIMAVKNAGELANAVLMLDKLVHPQKKKALKSNSKSAKSALLAALKKSKETSKPVGKMEPLEHDESKFPQNVTKSMLEDALKKTGEDAGGHGSLGTSIVEIDGKKYICKHGYGNDANVVRNGFNADMAYRAGGIHAPDAKLYQFSDGSTYKLSEFIPGKKLFDVWKDADEETRENLRKEILKGFPLDVLMLNYDALGTSPEVADQNGYITIEDADGKPESVSVAFDNIIIGEDGHAYRVDNDGSFGLTGKGYKKGKNWKWTEERDEHNNIIYDKDGKPKMKKVSAIGGLSDEVSHEFYDAWDKREWIDEFRTMRRNMMNRGIYDRFSTADIFLAASHIDLDSVMNSLPSDLQEALEKPAAEMEEMGDYAKGTALAGYVNSPTYSWRDSIGQSHTIKLDPVSSALDAIYEAHKQNVRPFLQQKFSWVDTGWLSGHDDGSGAVYTPKEFAEAEPKEPKPPPKGTNLAQEVLAGIKTINYHAKQGDGNVNQEKIDRALAVKPMLQMLSDEGNKKADGLLEAIGKIEESIANGHGKEVKFNTKDGLLDVAGLSIVMGDEEEEIFNENNADAHAKWEVEHRAWAKRKTKHDRREAELAARSGGAPTKSFQTFEDELIKANIDTNGIRHGDGDPSINKTSKDAQKDTSFCTESCKKKVRQYAMMGIPLDAMYFGNNDKTFYNGHVDHGGNHVSGYDTDEKDYYAAVKYYQDNPEQFKKDMESYARHKGMMALVHTNMDNEAIDRDTGTVFVMRDEHKEAWGKDGANAPAYSSPHIIPPWPIDSSTSACINDTGHLGDVKVAWKLPIWRITDTYMIGDGGEEEIDINPINIPYPAMYFPYTVGQDADVSRQCQKTYEAAKEVKAVDKKLGKKE